MELHIFKSGTYKGVSEVFDAIRKELQRLQPIDSATIKHTITSAGVVSSVIDSDVGSEPVSQSYEVVRQDATHQFYIIENSVEGNYTIYVVNGDMPDSNIAGTLNGVQYQTAEFTVPNDGATYHVYAIDGAIYMLNHTFSSDLLPVLLIGSVSVVDGMLDIVQINAKNDPIVPVCGEQYGAVTLKGTLNYADYTLTATYTVSVKGMLNNLPFELEATTVPETATKLWAYVSQITVDNDTSPVSGFEFAESVSKEWSEMVLSYTLTATEFRVLYRKELLHSFTFTRIYLNATEATE